MNDTILCPKYPHFLHGGDYNPDQWLDRPDILEKDIQLMKEAHVNCVSVGIFAWAHLEPQEGVYEFDWLEQIINNLYENGIYTVLATPSGAKPVWMSEKYPEIRRVNSSLHRELSGERHNHCYTSPIYREKVREMNTRLAERFSRHPGVILWHISNEYGGECYCPLCQEAFREWLKEKYGTLEALNHAWWAHFWSHTYTDWSQIHAPVPSGEMSVHGLIVDWKRFVTARTVDFMREEIKAVKSVNPEIPVTANLMSFYDGLDYFKFGPALDVVSWDSYPLWHNADIIQEAARVACCHDLMRSVKHQPFLLMESTPSMTNWQPISKLKRPGMHELSSLQAVAHGSQSVQYFQWRKSRGSFEKFHGAVVDHYGGSDTRVFRDVASVGKRLENLEAAVLPTRVQPEVAIVYDWENRWAVEDAKGPRNGGLHYVETVQAHHRAFWKNGVPVDFVDMDGDLSGYKVVVTPMLYMYRNGFAKKLRDFVEQGGTLVSTYWSGIVDDTDLCFLGGWPGDGMMDVFGIWNEEIDALYDGETNAMELREPVDGLRESYSLRELCEIIHLRGAKALAAYGQDFYAGSPVLTENQFGKGTAYYIAARAEDGFQEDFYRMLVKKLGIRRALDTVLPEGVTASLRKGEQDVVFVQNFTAAPQTVRLPHAMKDVESGETLSGDITLAPWEIRTLLEQ